MKKLLIIFAVIGAVVVVSGWWRERTTTAPLPVPDSVVATSSTVTARSATYQVEGTMVTLSDGVASTPAAPGSAALVITRYFGNDVSGDVNGDGRVDQVFFLTQEQGGSGTFYYVAAALTTESGVVGTEAYFLGDRITPQTISIDGGVVAVNFAERAPGEPFYAKPSIGKTVRLKLDGSTRQWGIVANDFEGEADPARLSLTMQPWRLQSVRSGGALVALARPEAFVLTLTPDGTFSATTDCNNQFGTYRAGDNEFLVGDIGSTMMYCEGSQEQLFSNGLATATQYEFTSKGELWLFDPARSVELVFR